MAPALPLRIAAPLLLAGLLSTRPATLRAEVRGVAKDSAQRKGASAAQLQLQVDEALGAFDGGDFAAALLAFDRAVELARAPEQLANLHFNAGVCLLELGRPAAAEQRFVASAEAHPSGYDTARLHAALAAASDGRLPAARRHRAASSAAADPTLIHRVDEAIAAGEEAQRRNALEELLGEAREAQSSGRRERAREGYEAALELAHPGPETARIHYGLALLAQRRGDDSGALAELTAAIRADPSRYEYHWLRAALYAGQLDNAAARDGYRQALRARPPEADRQRIQSDLDQLHPAGPSDVRASLSLGGGLDSNANQSGSARRLGLTGGAQETPASSAMFSADLALSLRRRLGERWAIEPGVFFSNLTLASETVQDLSLAMGAAGVSTLFSPSERSLLSLDVSASHARTGVQAQTAFQSEAALDLEAQYELGPGQSAAVSAGYAKLFGHDSGALLDGHRVHASLIGRWARGRWGTNVSLDGFWVGAGAEVRPAAGPIALLCLDLQLAGADTCDNLSKIAPLSYAAPRLSVRGYVLPAGQLLLSAGGALEYRRYLDPSNVLTQDGAALPRTETDRRDWMTDLEVGASLPLLPNEGLIAWSQYQLRINRSTQEPDPEDPEHRFDFEDRNFVQHLVQVGVRVEL